MHNLRPRFRTMPQVMHGRHAEGTEGERRSRRRSSRQIRLSQVRRRVMINHRAVAIAEGSLRFMDREETRIPSLSPDVCLFTRTRRYSMPAAHRNGILERHTSLSAVAFTSLDAARHATTSTRIPVLSP